MTDIKRYTVNHEWHDHTVTLEVDHARLTAENAALYLTFWTGGDEFAEDEGGDPVRGLVRYFGAVTMRQILAEYGSSFGETNAEASRIWSAQIRDTEGFGGEDGSPFGSIGIRILAADIEAPGFDDVVLKELSAA
jgi:hypothetical protein